MVRNYLIKINVIIISNIFMVIKIIVKDVPSTFSDQKIHFSEERN